MPRTRPRGFIYDWEPKPQTATLIGTVSDILEENRDLLPLTLRQIFYMLVSNHEYDKTEQAYSRLCETMNKARRARVISMSAIRDDGFREQGGGGWDNEEQLVDSFKSSATRFVLDRQAEQPVRVFLWCEAQGMMPQLARAVRDYHIPVLSSGGFDSVTTKHDMASRLSDEGEVEILHLGDHDPSGVHLFSSLDEDLQAFLEDFGGDVTMTRLAVTPDQVRSMNLPTAPPKRTDNRSFEGQTTQCEAIPPRTLAQIVRDAVEDRIDQDIYQENLDREQEIRKRLIERLSDL